MAAAATVVRWMLLEMEGGAAMVGSDGGDGSRCCRLDVAGGDDLGTLPDMDGRGAAATGVMEKTLLDGVAAAASRRHSPLLAGEDEGGASVAAVVVDVAGDCGGGLRSRWICNHDVVANLSNGSDHPIGASPVVGCADRFMRKMGFGVFCLGCRET
ncbi:hypothetical protein ACLOJK_018518 [Asimina triloba]